MAVPYFGENLTYQGRIFTSAGTPLENANVQFSLQIRSPGVEDCILLDELQQVNMTGSGGYFTLNIGKGTRVGTDAGLSFAQIFQNT